MVSYQKQAEQTFVNLSIQAKLDIIIEKLNTIEQRIDLLEKENKEV